MKSKLTKKINEVINTYDSVVKVVDKDANESNERAYGGVIRSVKGKLQEHITEEIINIAWESIGGNKSKLLIDNNKHKIPIKQDYIAELKDEEIKKYIKSNIDDYFFGVKLDKQVCINKKLVMAIECKSYTENAMIKRILVDFSLLKTVCPNITCYLFQLESQLGGDYCKLQEKIFGSKSTHTLMSYFPNVDLKIFTFLKGERKIDSPIHKQDCFKPLKKEQVEKAIFLLANDFKKYL